MLLDTEQDLFL